jgi:hypothetical protein
MPLSTIARPGDRLIEAFDSAGWDEQQLWGGTTPCWGSGRLQCRWTTARLARILTARELLRSSAAAARDDESLSSLATAPTTTGCALAIPGEASAPAPVSPTLEIGRERNCGHEAADRHRTATFGAGAASRTRRFPASSDALRMVVAARSSLPVLDRSGAAAVASGPRGRHCGGFGGTFGACSEHLHPCDPVGCVHRLAARGGVVMMTASAWR